MNCPACQQEMHHAMVREVELDVCPRCAGVFLDPSELDLLLGLPPESSVEERLDQTASLPETCRYCDSSWPGRASCGECGKALGMRCPRDQKGMYIVEAAGVELDRCPRCKGIWVDGFERARLSSMKKALREVAHVVVAAEMIGGAEPEVAEEEVAEEEVAEEEVAEEETNGEFYETINQFQAVEIQCVNCEVALSRYTAWKRPDGFWCVSCAKDDGEAAETYRALEKCFNEAPKVPSDEEQVLDALKWAVGGLLNKAKGR